METYKTTDLTEAAFLRTRGYELGKIKPIDNVLCEVEINAVEEELRILINEYKTQEVTINMYEFSKHLKFIRYIIKKKLR